MDNFVYWLGIGLLTGAHCVAMCGCLVLTYAIQEQPGASLARRMAPHIAYQGAKLASYVLVGLLLGYIGAVLDIGALRGWITAGAGALMIILGLNMTGKFPALRRFTLRPPKVLVNALASTRKRAKSDAEAGVSHLATPLTFGLLTGFMPCGPLQAAQVAAVGTGSALTGATIMLGFGVGTMPLMLGFGAVSGYLGSRARQAVNVVAALLIVGFGLVMLNRGAMLLGSPVTYQTVQQAVLGSPETAAQEYQAGADGVVEVPLVIENTRFVPASLDIPADKPVRLVVDRREDNACSDQIAVPQLGILQNLTPFGTTVVELPAADAGTYTLTCGMGMMAGSLVVGGAAGASWPRVLALAAFLGIAVFVVFRLTRKRGTAAAPAGGSGRGKRTAPAPGLVLGFTPQEVLVGVAVVGTAIVVGLSLGGMLSP